ncbi:sensor histidine kinase [Microbacterium oxydans]|uniref:sensor histidine kinase n=1 Tax=Microbacterium oxydans TaxID=82380 RepID=UPI000F8FB127|nr:ATP-binding protein [Microbacterium oxydans]AZS48521.1 hypothetical protein CVS53_03242 [Microbacterium oxydans]
MSATAAASAGDSAEMKLRDLDRVLSRLLATGGLMILLMWLVIDVVVDDSEYAGWWVSGHGALAASFLLMAIAPPRLLTVRVLDHAWVLIPVLGIFLQLTAFIAESRPRASGLPADYQIWQVTWMLTAVYLCFLALRIAQSRAASRSIQLIRVALLGGAFAFAPALGFWWEYRELPLALASHTIVQFTNSVFPVLLLLFRTRVISYFAVQERWRARAEAASAAKARLVEERELARLAHDTVLGTLNSAALWFRGGTVTLPAPVVEMAREALHALDARADDESTAQPLSTVAQTIVSTAAQLGVEDVVVDCDNRSTTVPGPAASAVGDAVSEAVRNSLRHAPGAAPRIVASLSPDRIEVTVEDDGPGFDLAAVPLDRMGVRESIVRRMIDVPGGDALIESAPDRFTRVHLTWQHPIDVADEHTRTSSRHAAGAS